MFVCRACLRKGLGGLPYYARTTEARLVSSLRTIPSHGLRRRTFATVGRPGATIAPKNPAEEEGLDKEDQDAEDSPAAKRLEWVVRKHLQYLKDPKLIADHVKATLQKDHYLEALMLTRKASGNTKVTVSWNHLIDYLMKNQRLHAAIKLYNEMKKRGQIPDATTYTIIFRGCAVSEHPKLAVTEALRIYNKMISIGNIKPNTIHFNAVLNVCARAGDIESLFTVVNTANNNLRNPNNLSYTVILNALRHQAWDTKDMAEEDIKKNTQLAITRARTIWEEVVERWRNGEINVDEELVCAMGRVLSTGDNLDNDSIMELLEQTMQIPNFNKTNQTAAALSEPVKELASSTEEATTTTTIPTAEDVDSPEPTEEQPKPEKPESFEPKKAEIATTTTTPAMRPYSFSPSTSGKGIYPKPGNNTLSLILSSFLNTRKTTLGPKYWDYFTKTLGVSPDKDNYLRYMRVLCKGHASAKAAEVIPQVPIDLLTPMLYRVAFTCCTNDALNPTSFENSKAIFRDMIKRTRIPDPLCMSLFLVSCHNVRSAFAEEYKTDPEAFKLRLGLQLVTALDMLWAPFRVLARSFSFPANNIPGPIYNKEHEHHITKEKKQQMLRLARKLFAAYDKVILGSMVPPSKMVKTLNARKTVIVQFIERYTLKLQKSEENARDAAEGNLRPSRKGRAQEWWENWEEEGGEVKVEEDARGEYRVFERRGGGQTSRGDRERRGGGGGDGYKKGWKGEDRRGGGGHRREQRDPVSVYKVRKPTDRLRKELGERW